MKDSVDFPISVFEVGTVEGGVEGEMRVMEMTKMFVEKDLHCILCDLFKGLTDLTEKRRSWKRD
jgi:hypothetical protein